MSLLQWARKIDDGVVSKTRKERELCQSGVMKGVIIQPQSERKTLSMFFRVHHVCWVLSSKFMNISIYGQEGSSQWFLSSSIVLEYFLPWSILEQIKIFELLDCWEFFYSKSWRNSFWKERHKWLCFLEKLWPQMWVYICLSI